VEHEYVDAQIRETREKSGGMTEPRPDWNLALVWSAFGLLGWLAFELTAQPAVGVAVVCSRFGWNDFLTAFWLLRKDPHRARARACGWYCLALGTTRILVAAFVLIMLVTTVMQALQDVLPNQNANPNPPDAVYGLVFLMLLVSPVLAVFAVLGSVAARRGGTRVWLDASLSRARRDNIWPPEYPSGPVNSLETKARLAWLSMLVILITGALVVAGTVVFVLSRAAGAIVLVAASVLIPRVARGVIAQHPAECWAFRDRESE
jgi:hypothetical protein